MKSFSIVSVKTDLIKTLIFNIAWEENATYNLKGNTSIPTTSDDTSSEGCSKGHTNLIADSCLALDIAQGQKKVTTTSGKPVLQFIRQSANKISADNFRNNDVDKTDANEAQNNINDAVHSRESTPDTFLAAGCAERAFFSVCLEGNKTECKGADAGMHSKNSADAALKSEIASIDSKYSDNEDDKVSSIKVVSDILGEIEVEHQQQRLENTLNNITQDLIDINDIDANNSGRNTSDDSGVTNPHETTHHSSFEYKEASSVDQEDTIRGQGIEKHSSKGRTTDSQSNVGSAARSLIVDIHIPPNNEDSSFFDEEETKMKGVVETNTSRKDDSTLRPCKHEINRSQRCYSDTSHLDKKRKHKVSVVS